VAYPNTRDFFDWYVADPLLGRRLVPNLDGWRSSVGESRVYFRTNSHGLRGDEIPYEKPPDHFRIMILGDSFVEGYSVAEEDTLSEQLSALLNRRDDLPPIEVINAGTSTYTTANETLFFESEGLRYEPDAVLLVYYAGNDVIENVPFGGVEWEQAEPLTVGDLGDAYAADTNQPSETVDPLLVQLRYRLRESSLLVHYTMESARRLPIAARLAGALGGSYVANAHQLYNPHPPEEIETAWTTTQRTLERLARICDQRDIHLLVVVWPEEPEYDDDMWERRQLAYPATKGHDQTLPSSRTTELLGDLSIPYYSLLPVMQSAWQESDRGNALMFGIDGHPTPDGYAVAAEAIGEFILQSGVIPQES
jgi:lysophospholipase L1-like esterase